MPAPDKIAPGRAASALRIQREDAPVTAVVSVEKAEIPSPAPATTASVTVQPGSAEPINPVKVKTISVKAGAVQIAGIMPLAISAPQATVAPPNFATTAQTAAAAAGAPLPPPPGARPGILGVLPAEPVRPAATFQTASATTTPAQLESARAAQPRGPWLIQVGAFPKETEALDRLREAKVMGKTVLAKAEPFTEKFVKGSQEYHRARFDGLSQSSAESACKFFKHKDIPCIAIKN
jgi:D-alanyl-D-alanine carboxypeptidase